MKELIICIAFGIVTFVYNSEHATVERLVNTVGSLEETHTEE